MNRKLKLVDDGPILARRYPVERRFNPDVPGAEWPFAETVKEAGDVVISLAPIETRRAKTAKLGLVRRMKAGFRSKLCGGRHDQG